MPYKSAWMNNISNGGYYQLVCPNKHRYVCIYSSCLKIELNFKRNNFFNYYLSGVPVYRYLWWFTVWAFNVIFIWNTFFLNQNSTRCINALKYVSVRWIAVQCNSCLLARIFPAYTKLIIICTNPYWMANVCTGIGEWLCSCVYVN